MALNAWLPRIEAGSDPKYQVIARAFAQAILNGQLPAGEKLPPHRSLASELHVTTGTISRAYAELERQGLANARVGDGTYVAQARARELSSGASRAAALSGMQATSTLIDLGQNVPQSTQEAASLSATLRDIASDEQLTATLLQYAPEAGSMRHRLAGAAWLARAGAPASATRVLVTQGAQHALASVLRAVARPGDTVLAEAVSYPGIIALARQLRLHLVGVEIDHEGLVPAALELACNSLHPRAVFCLPTIHNPTTATMSTERRDAVAQILQRHGVLLIEDLVPAMLMDVPPEPLSVRLPEQSFLIAGLSKSVAPGLRVGYLQAPSAWCSKIAAVIRSDCWMTAPLMAEVVSRWIEDGEMERLNGLQRAHIESQHEIAREVLADVPYRHADASSHLWLPLPEPWRATEFAAALRQEGVLVKTADSFVIGRNAAPHAIRICMTGASSTAALTRALTIIRTTLEHGLESGMASSYAP
ncbi:PLP-dependent aminotransferase family protein [Paraburkholderia sp. BL10I2N1]|uniref:aminotransferase-like domain-containing protein n=1 Tax=Paraburkholderia sp. BL10I2N1 TaxID=1938796 RepID=UPI001060FF9C|nr:PLP-dependent aminotransferase family protein [Paraburkholderia sp. BL10I2N1]TDN68702.1 GntR family transcriptional regulator [Paraburkholderia sp. BL10I2N1]